MLFCAGCQSRDKKEKTAARTEDLDEATLEGMSEDITKKPVSGNKDRTAVYGAAVLAG